ncbi:MAG: FAD-dependent oxidoreductase [Pseudomonadota bacterium]
MRIAIIGAGISGLTAAWLLRHEHHVEIFEANDYPGGHTDTHEFEIDGRSWRVDSGFIVFNPANYPLFSRLLAELGVESQGSDMSFSSRNDRTGLEYNATRLATLFCQRRNLVRPRFYGMIRDILRFYREAPALLDGPDSGPTTGEYLSDHGYGRTFIDDHLVPMASALWSAPPEQVLDFPMKYMVRFFANHRMLQTDDRPEWRVIQNGSNSYIGPLVAGLGADRVRLDTPVSQVRRLPDRVEVQTDDGASSFDRVIFACHSDQALAMIEAPTGAEREVLGAIAYQRNDTLIHTDTSVLPRRRAAWAAWNARVPEDPNRPCTVTYDMNILQSLDAPVEFLVTLNQDADIDPAKVLKQRVYHHPVYTTASVLAQQRFDEIDGADRLHFCGAYWGWGFHEDGVRSAVRVAEKLDGAWCERAA